MHGPTGRRHDRRGGPRRLAGPMMAALPTRAAPGIASVCVHRQPTAANRPGTSGALGTLNVLERLGKSWDRVVRGATTRRSEENVSCYEHGRPATAADERRRSPFGRPVQSPLAYHGMGMLSMPTATAARLGTARLAAAHEAQRRLASCVLGTCAAAERHLGSAAPDAHWHT